MYRYYQEEADHAIYEELLVQNKCIVKMFCGTGKSLLMRNCKSIEGKKLVVFVFPSLSLIDQFYTDYLNNYPAEQILKISSEAESTTDPVQITRFLSMEANKMICITYQSFETLLQVLGNVRIDVCLFDEAHHAVGETYQKLIFENPLCEKQIFFTATPKNANGIVMYDRDNLEAGMCGRLVYDYSYLRGVNEGYLNPFEIRIDMFTENINKSLYESIARAILASGNNRVLTFHSDVNTDRDKSVNNFVNDAEFKRVFKDVQKKEFPHIKTYKKVSMIGLSSAVQGKERTKILATFDESGENEVIVISSCETIGEGIDTKNANMCVFVDPKSSYVKIIQNIGRIVRKVFGVDKPNSTILIPCWVDKSKYLDCDGDREKCDEVIRQDMSADGNFNGILNVMSALKQEDEDLYDICLYYPDTFSPQEIRSNLEKQGYMIADQVGDGGLMETMEYLLELDMDYEEYEDCDSEEEMIMRIAEDKEVCIEIHTNSLENPVERYNSECESGEVIRLYKNPINVEDEEEDIEEVVYQPIVRKSGAKRNGMGLCGPRRDRRLNVNVHTNPDVKVLWRITGDLDLTKDICSCVIDCEVVDKWFQNFEDLKQFIDENGRKPVQRLETEKKLNKWLSHQTTNYNKKEHGMKDKTKYNLWTAFLAKYKEYFEVWYETFEQVKTFINKNKQKPVMNSPNEPERILGKWLSHQTSNYNKKEHGMKDETKYNLWTSFLEEYQEYFKTIHDIWYENFEQANLFISKNNKRPSDSSKNETEKKIGQWVQTQTSNYKHKKESMKDQVKYDLWTTFLEKYKEYFKSNDEVWYETFEEVKSFINKNKKRPSDHLKNEIEKKLGNWVNAQQANYKKKLQAMKDQTKYDLWTAFLEDYNDYFKSNDELWYKTFEQVKTFINENNKRPSEQKLGGWIQRQNVNYSKKQKSMKDETKYNLWTVFLAEYKEYFKSDHELWYETMDELKKYIDENNRKPVMTSKNETEKKLGKWLSHQTCNYNKKEHGMKDPERYNLWTEFIQEYAQYFKMNNNDSETQSVSSPSLSSLSLSTPSVSTKSNPILKTPTKKKSMKLPKPSIPVESPDQRRQRVKSEISVLHQEYKTLKSTNLFKKFNSDPSLWHKYHEISEANEASFPEDEIPRNRVVQELNKIKTKRTKQVVDMGCGKAQIAHYFATDTRFEFINYDHISSNDKVISCDIANTPLEEDSVEICILSLAMWGSNCREYVQEANRILESGGKIYIIEPTKRWSELDENKHIVEGRQGSRLASLLEENGFQIVEQSIEKFCMFICIKI